ncbi:hypothetical protein PoB_000197900 [Plakobranchus ocellatus]|uniref:Uncharacterized protein n=1 Tax=Plakobranchus ocellatus TaxID=259542 RepID=A0AAV3Y0G6_9GAST|nr:hypothetical protein PoB_000197900 [Plakobranchus ocellatus]
MVWNKNSRSGIELFVNSQTRRQHHSLVCSYAVKCFTLSCLTLKSETNSGEQKHKRENQNKGNGNICMDKILIAYVRVDFPSRQADCRRLCCCLPYVKLLCFTHSRLASIWRHVMCHSRTVRSQPQGPHPTLLTATVELLPIAY